MLSGDDQVAEVGGDRPLDGEWIDLDIDTQAITTALGSDPDSAALCLNGPAGSSSMLRVSLARMTVDYQPKPSLYFSASAQSANNGNADPVFAQVQQGSPAPRLFAQPQSSHTAAQQAAKAEAGKAVYNTRYGAKQQYSASATGDHIFAVVPGHYQWWLGTIDQTKVQADSNTCTENIGPGNPTGAYTGTNIDYLGVHYKASTAQSGSVVTYALANLSEIVIPTSGSQSQDVTVWSADGDPASGGFWCNFYPGLKPGLEPAPINDFDPGGLVNIQWWTSRHDKWQPAAVAAGDDGITVAWDKRQLGGDTKQIRLANRIYGTTQTITLDATTTLDDLGDNIVSYTFRDLAPSIYEVSMSTNRRR